MATAIQYDGGSTYTVTFDEDDFILTTVTSEGEEVESWLHDIQYIHRRRLRRLVVGLDAEWRPNFSPHDDNPIALLQLCVGRRCLLFQILHADYVPQELSDFLSDDRFRFVGVGIKGDADRLWDEYQLGVANTVDLRGLAAERMGRSDLNNAGLQSLMRAVMGVHAEKPRAVRLSKWDAHTLTSRQIMYACTDAFASFEVGRRLFAGDF